LILKYFSSELACLFLVDKKKLKKLSAASNQLSVKRAKRSTQAGLAQLPV